MAVLDARQQVVEHFGLHTCAVVAHVMKMRAHSVKQGLMLLQRICVTAQHK